MVPVSRRKFNCGAGADGSNGVFSNPANILDSGKIYLRKDTQTFDFHVKRLHNESSFQNDNNENAQSRLVWTIPEAIERAANGTIGLDERGQISQIKRVKVVFTNHLHDDISILGNTPHGDLVNKDVIVSRDHQFEHILRPGKKKTINIRSFGDNDNTYGPLIGLVGPKDGKVRAVALMDWAGKVANISEFTGGDYPPDRLAISVRVEVFYDVVEHMLNDDQAGHEEVKRDIFGVVGLKSLEDITDVETKLIPKQLDKPNNPILNPGPVGSGDAPTWTRVEANNKHFIKLEYQGLDGENGYVFALVHCDATGTVSKNVQLDDVQAGDHRIILPGLAVTSSRADFYCVSVLKYDPRGRRWLVEDARDSTGYLRRADAAGHIPVLPDDMPIMVYKIGAPSNPGYPDECPCAPRAWHDNLVTLVTAVSEVISVASKAAEVAAYFL